MSTLDEVRPAEPRANAGVPSVPVPARPRIPAAAFSGRPPYRHLKRRLAAGALGCLIVATLWIAARHPVKPHVPPAPPPIDRNMLHETGTIEALSETPVLSRFTGDVVWMIEEGTRVEKGDPVVRLDTRDIEDDILSREKDLSVKQDAVRRARESVRHIEERYKAAVRQAEIDLELAELEKARVFNYPPAEDRRGAELTLKSAELELRQYDAELKSYEELASRGFVSEAAHKKKKLERATHKINQVKAKALCDLMLQGSAEDAKRLAEIAVADAKKRLQIARFNSQADAAVHQADLQLAEIDLANWERNLKRKRLEFSRATVRAPASGRVAFVEVFKGPGKVNSPVQIGETRGSGSDVAIICDTSAFRVRIWVNESDVHRVHAGQRATLRMAAFPGRTFEAVVSELAVVAVDKNAALSSLALRSAGESFVNVVQAKLDFTGLAEEDRKQFRINCTADVYLRLDDAAPADAPQKPGAQP